MQTPIREVSVSGETGGEKDITAQDLKDALDQKKEDRQGELWKKYSIIESITHVRTQLESYQAGGLGIRSYRFYTSTANGLQMRIPRFTHPTLVMSSTPTTTKTMTVVLKRKLSS